MIKRTISVSNITDNERQLPPLNGISAVTGVHRCTLFHLLVTKAHDPAVATSQDHDLLHRWPGKVFHEISSFTSVGVGTTRENVGLHRHNSSLRTIQCKRATSCNSRKIKERQVQPTSLNQNIRVNVSFCLCSENVPYCLIGLD